MFVGYLWRREDNPMCGEEGVYDPISETEWPEEIIKIYRLQIIVVNNIDCHRVSCVLAFNKRLNCTCYVSYFGLKSIILSRDIFDYYLIIEEVNPELGGLIEFTKRSLSLQVGSLIENKM